MNPEVLLIVEEWLREHGYDGLAYPDLECGCGVDDFAPCNTGHFDGPTPLCQAAYRHSDGLFYLEQEATSE